MEGRSVIKLSIADNGIIKEIHDYDVNGTGTSDDYVIVYQYDEDDKEKRKDRTIELLCDLIEDLNLEVGNKSDMNVVRVMYERGEDYEPTPAFIRSKIEDLKSELNYYKKLQNKEES